jgi:hypothetical protein
MAQPTPTGLLVAIAWLLIWLDGWPRARHALVGDDRAADRVRELPGVQVVDLLDFDPAVAPLSVRPTAAAPVEHKKR